MRQLAFDKVFKPSADEIAKGTGEINLPKEYPEFGKLIADPIQDLKEFIRSQIQTFLQRYNEDNSYEIVTEANLKYVRELGSGAFGTVSMVKCLLNGIYYARKTMTKHNLVKSKYVVLAKNEKRILNSLRYPFTVQLEYFYKDNDNVHFLLPLLAGGELYDYITKKKRLSERLAKFVAAQILLALEYVHYVGIVHRDLKLENILIDHYGYIKISDFGLSKLIQHQRTYTMCGTAEYMAPEVIGHSGYGLAADWWSFGVLVFEICNGYSPFYERESVKIFNLISLCKYTMPKHFSSELCSLTDNLLQKDLSRRIGNLKNGVNDIKNQSWFRNVPWLAILNRQIVSPMVPFVSDKHNQKFFEVKPEPKKIVSDVDLYADQFEDF